MSETYAYCGTDKENHENGHTYSKRRHVTRKGGGITRTMGTAKFYGGCDKKARNDEDWDL